ncbi:glycoside hydrolase family 117 protein [Labilibaculum antarcticum]|uniref:Glycoside hydrolase n=1 Tax=Labilibaculum antarcticum TaxID=1717717 RepID=A0A1Y1CDQ5_9BACT|nr:glycoside hydrolase [Labilibaculum antarcticum]BAX78464.1 glycoside hydrolase [Labilibaculum antarcticum]
MKNIIIAFIVAVILSSCDSKQGPFPYTVTKETANRELSAAMKRSFENYDGIHPFDNELYSQFKYTELKGLDYHGHDGTISRRDPSKVIFENGKYYVWYTYRNTIVPPIGAARAAESTDSIPSTDWDLCEIWYATSEDGFTWEEQGVAIPRPPKPEVGWRSVSTTDILKWKEKYYLYYQGFLEASGKSGDYCPVAMSYADSPNGPWTPVKGAVIENGPEGSWDQYAIHDPYPLVHDGKIYLYYKSAFNRPGNVWVAGGLAIAEDPMGPFKKHPLNPVLNSGHEVSLFPFKEGVAAIMVKDGNEHFTINYAKDWVNFEVAAYTEMTPIAPGPFVPDAFTNTTDGRGITWGLSHFTNAGKNGINPHSILARFDCDLSQDIHDPVMKQTGTFHNIDVYFKQGINIKQRERINDQTKKVKENKRK